MTMIVTPRRHDKVLTHRTSNRRNLGAADNGESDSCFERDGGDVDDKRKSQQRRLSNNLQLCTEHPIPGNSAMSPVSPSAPSSTGSPIFSFGGSNRQQQQKRRRRKKQTYSAAWQATTKAMTILLFLLAAMGCSLWAMPSPDNRHIIDSVTVSAAVGAVTTADGISRRAAASVDPIFQQYSVDAPTSCNDNLDETEVEFTLVSQVSDDRLWMMEHHCRRWTFRNQTYYPISIAVLTNSTLEQIQQQIRDMGCDFKNNIVMVQTLSAALHPPDEYPVNTLRNLALKAVQTSHVVYIDIDFWISKDLSQILQLPEVISQLSADPKSALVIPAFMLNRQCHDWRECPEANVPEMPQDLHELKIQILAHEATRFDPTNRGGHGSTRYKDWFKQNRVGGDALIEIDCFLSNRYEPYLVFRYCKELPPFQEPFTGYGKNKMTWVMHLRHVGYTFWQLGKGAFVIHYPHLDSPSRLAWNNAPQHRNDPAVQWQKYKRGQMDQLFVEFREWLKKEVPDSTNTFFCEDKLDDDARLLYDRTAFNASLLAAL